MSRVEPHPESATGPDSGAPSRGWLSISAIRRLLHTFTDDFAKIPAVARRRWLSTFLIGFVASAGIVAGMTLWARSHLAEGTPQAERDALLLAFLADHRPISVSNAILLGSFGNLAFLIPLTLLCFVIAARRRRPLLASAFVLTSVMQWSIVLLGWWIWDRPRPDLRAASITAPELPSFPSGEAALTFSAYGLLAWLWMRSTQSRSERILAGALFLLLVAIAGWSRVMLSTHWPSDILAGWVAGLAWVIAVIAAQVRAERAGGL